MITLDDITNNITKTIKVGYGNHNDINVDNYSSFNDAIIEAKKKILYGGIILLSQGVYVLHPK